MIGKRDLGGNGVEKGGFDREGKGERVGGKRMGWMLVFIVCGLPNSQNHGNFFGNSELRQVVKVEKDYN